MKHGQRQDVDQVEKAGVFLLTAGLAGDFDRPQTLTQKTGACTESCAVLMSRRLAG